jgi:hypothetical protein
LIQALHIQAQLNTMNAEREAARHSLYFEVTHNLVIETTRLGIEVKNLTMRLESLASRLEFNERRARALESVVAYKSFGETEEAAPASAPPAATFPAAVAAVSVPPVMAARGLRFSRGARRKGPTAQPPPPAATRPARRRARRRDDGRFHRHRADSARRRALGGRIFRGRPRNAERDRPGTT